jgi:hypothetical protein
MSKQSDSRSLATERQKEYARSLGIDFNERITRAEISKLIDDAEKAQIEKRYQVLDDLEQRESEAWEKMRAQVLAEIDPEDCPLSKADTSQIVESLSKRRLAAILITIPWDSVHDFDDLRGTTFQISFADDMTLDEVEKVIISSAMTIMEQKGMDLVKLLRQTHELLTRRTR